MSFVTYSGILTCSRGCLSLFNTLSHFNILEIKILPGLTQAAIKFNFPSKDCISFNDAVSLSNQVCNNNFISCSLSGVTSIVIFSVLKRMPMNVITVLGGQALFLASSIPHFSKIALNVL